MPLILDTNVISNLRKERPHPALTAWLSRTDPTLVFSTTVTITEIQVGIERARSSAPGTAAAVEVWLDGMIRSGKPEFLALGVVASRTLGRMIETPALRVFSDNPPNAKHPKTGADLAISAIAIEHGSTMVTGDADHFLQVHRHFPLPGLYDPFKGEWYVCPDTGAGPTLPQPG